MGEFAMGNNGRDRASVQNWTSAFRWNSMEVTVAPDDAGMGTVNKDLLSFSLTSCPGISSPACVCEAGLCCGETGCYVYYELWWFWLLWTVLIVFCCCCVFRHRRMKLRLQQQRQREIELMVYQRACRYTPPHLQLSYLALSKLPSYEEAAADYRGLPPSYSAAFGLHGGILPSSYSLGTFSSCSSESSSLFSSSAPTDEMLTSSATTPSDSGDTSGLGLALPTLVEENTHEQSDSMSPPLPHPQGVEYDLNAEGGVEESPRVTPSVLKHTVFSSSVCVLEIERRADEEDPKENSFRLRTLTGDSGIEVCRCRVIQEDDDDDNEEAEASAVGGGAGLVHDSVDCSCRNLSDQSELPGVDCNLHGSASKNQRIEDSVVTMESS
ncbi:WW domain-binding protein 1-like [Pygocentrus nattereri]|uniref:WW domain-binding protein 1 n=1 Tax=Pygocentrus nattereri TaxID=42514 RepID=A0AAR2KR65_PYGNA|nr:WW domain-binding protein 1-like [Pygocentrus nattereri]